MLTIDALTPAQEDEMEKLEEAANEAELDTETRTEAPRAND